MGLADAEHTVRGALRVHGFLPLMAVPMGQEA
jgi:hypothetical protein